MDYCFTLKELKNIYNRIIYVPYCGAQHLLSMEEPIGYYKNDNGWRFDVYRVYMDSVVVTGYQRFGNIHPNKELIAFYDKAAEKVLHVEHSDYTKIQQILRKMLGEFVLKCLPKGDM